MKKTRALTSWLLVVVMLTSLLTIPASAAEESAQLKFTYPETIVQEEVTVELYQGFPTSGSATLSKMIEDKLLTALTSSPSPELTATISPATATTTFSSSLTLPRPTLRLGPSPSRWSAVLWVLTAISPL